MELMAVGELGIFIECRVTRVGQGAATDSDFEWNVTKQGICTLPSKYVRQQKTSLHSITKGKAVHTYRTLRCSMFDAKDCNLRLLAEILGEDGHFKKKN